MNIVNCVDREIRNSVSPYTNQFLPPPPVLIQEHVHELCGSVCLAEYCCDGHDHRVATISSEAIPCGVGHYHAFCVKTDYHGHYHEIHGETGPAIAVGGGNHIHSAVGSTSMQNCHSHDYLLTTLAIPSIAQP